MTTFDKDFGSHARTSGNEQRAETAHRPTYAAIYARSATANDRAAQSPLDWQIALCQQYCQQHGYTVEERHVYQEIASGADYRNRPGLRALCLAATCQEFEVVVIVSHDRLARNPLHVATLLESLDSMGIRVELLHEPPDAQEQFIQILHSFQVEQERERLKARTQQGRQRKTSLDIQPEEAALLRILFEYAASGSELSTLATQLTPGELSPFSPGLVSLSDTQPSSVSDTTHHNR